MTQRTTPPGWPALMDEATASAYLQLGENSFATLMHRKGVRPVELGELRARRWRKADLDDLVAGLAARPAGPGAVQSPQPSPAANEAAQLDLAGAALERVTRRASRRPGSVHEIRPANS